MTNEELVKEISENMRQTAVNIINLQAELARVKVELMTCRNELCLRCGEYKRRHLGACDGCRWLEVGDA